MKRAREMILIRELDGVQSLEDKLLFSNGRDTPEISEAARAFCKSHFGELKCDVQDFYDQLDAPFLGAADFAEMMLGHGVDFRQQNGDPLRCTEIIAMRVEAAAKGLAGSMPTSRSISADKWERDLTKAAEAFTTNKRRRP